MTFSVRWFGFGGNSWQAEALREDLELNGIELKTCHEYPNADVRYSPDTIFEFINGADVIILPARQYLQPAKSVNRLALAWSCRKACVIYPLDSYLKYAKHEENALIAVNQEEMLQAILRLKGDTTLKDKLAGSGHNTAIKFLHPHRQVDKLFEALRDVKAADPWPVETLVQIVIPHYAERFDYLSLAVTSVLESWGPRRDILIVSSAKRNLREADLYWFKDHRVRYYHNPKDRLSFSQANNHGIKMALPYATHILLLNDDTIMGATALGDMFGVLGNKVAILNPYSNCDKGWLHHDKLVTTSELEIYPNMTIDQVALTDGSDGFADRHIRALKNFEPVKKTPDLVEAPFCAMYCTLFPKEVLTRVGNLNTGFSNGGEDADYAYRANRLNIPTYWTHNAFVFHFRGQTRKFAEDENHAAHHEEDKRNNSLLKLRWPKEKKRIGIWTGPAWEKWDLESYRTTGIGGSETCAGRLAETAAADGHYVVMYGAHERKDQNGVHLIPWNEFIPEEEYFDLFVASRNVNCIDDRLKANNILVWSHDIWVSSMGTGVTPYHRSRVTKFVCLSPWHKGFFSGHHNIQKEDIAIIPNGINTELFDEKPNLDNKVFGKFIYSSSPDRELDNLIYILKFVKEQVPETHLDVYYGFYNWESAARQRNNVAELKRIDEFKRLIEDAKDYVNMKGRVSQPELAKAWQKTYMWLYPTCFTETFAISAKEAQLSATPILCSNVAALQTTVGDFGYRVQHHPKSFEGRTEFFNKAVHVLKNKDEWVRLAKISYEGAKNISWGDRWRDYWSKWI